MHTAFLLAAGFGTRLRPLTLVRPKPLLPVCGIPMLDYALAHVRKHGHEHVIVNAHYLWQQVAAWADLNDVTLQVELPIVLGTGGGNPSFVRSFNYLHTTYVVLLPPS